LKRNGLSNCNILKYKPVMGAVIMFLPAKVMESCFNVTGLHKDSHFFLFNAVCRCDCPWEQALLLDNS
jgi:hypothetical protein